jgi:hypothetical protein
VFLEKNMKKFIVFAFVLFIELNYSFILDTFVSNFLLGIILLLFYFILFISFLPKNEILQIKKYSLIFSVIIFLLTLFL